LPNAPHAPADSLSRTRPLAPTSLTSAAFIASPTPPHAPSAPPKLWEPIDREHGHLTPGILLRTSHHRHSHQRIRCNRRSSPAAQTRSQLLLQYISANPFKLRQVRSSNSFTVLSSAYRATPARPVFFGDRLIDDHISALACKRHTHTRHRDTPAQPPSPDTCSQPSSAPRPQPSALPSTGPVQLQHLHHAAHHRQPIRSIISALHGRSGRCAKAAPADAIHVIACRERRRELVEYMSVVS